jgi:hypothetical protein
MRAFALYLVVLGSIQSLTFHATAAEYIAVTDIAAEAVIIPAAAAEREKIWPRANTAYWTPTFPEIQTLEAQFPRFLRSEVRRRPEFRTQITEIRRGLSQSRRQYVGLIIQGEKQILVNAFPADQTLPWKRQFIEVSDGGARYWSVRYDMQHRTFQNLLFNGPG